MRQEATTRVSDMDGGRHAGRPWLVRGLIFAAGSLLLWIAGVLSIALSDVQQWYITNDPYGHSASPPEPDSTSTVLLLVAGVFVFWTVLVLGLLVWSFKDRASFQRASANRNVLERVPPKRYRRFVMTAALLIWGTVVSLLGAVSILIAIQHSN